MFRSYREIIEIKILADVQDSEVLASIITEALEAHNFKQLDAETWTPMMGLVCDRIVNQRFVNTDMVSNG